MAVLAFERVCRTYPGGTRALDDFSLEVGEGELLVLLGPSGCGKSTALRLVAGLDAPTSGRIRIGGEDVTPLPPRERDVAMVFQSYALYPHKTVAENLAFGLRMRRMPRAEIERRVAEVAEVLGLGGLLARRPAQLSGGQRQRVALGRALVRRARVFLLDEPLSNLDARLRLEMRAEIARIHRRVRATMLYVTHDQEEAMTLGHRVAVLRAGRLEQVGSPLEVYHRPASVFVAGFVGSPPMNLLPGVVTEAGGRPAWEGAGLRIPLARAGSAPPAREVVLGIRPHDVLIGAAGSGEQASCEATVELVEPLGSSTVVRLRAGSGGRVLVASLPGDAAPPEGARVAVRLPPRAIYLFDARSGKRIAGGEDR